MSFRPNGKTSMDRRSHWRPCCSVSHVDLVHSQQLAYPSQLLLSEETVFQSETIRPAAHKRQYRQGWRILRIFPSATFERGPFGSSLDFEWTTSTKYIRGAGSHPVAVAVSGETGVCPIHLILQENHAHVRWTALIPKTYCRCNLGWDWYK